MMEQHHYFKPEMGARFLLALGSVDHLALFPDDYLRFVWNHQDEIIRLNIDHEPVELLPKQLLCLTHAHQVHFYVDQPMVVQLIFNKSFYCIHVNDKEVSCRGLLFQGLQSYSILDINEFEESRFMLLVNIMKEEFALDALSKEEMLRILLKRFIIRATRIGQQQLITEAPEGVGFDAIREYNALVDEHFRQYHKVSDYAKLMNKASKTLSNLFSKHVGPSPLQVIHNRQILEAKRMLLHTDLSVKEIQFSLGFQDPAQFSKFFKSMVGYSCSEFREIQLGKN